MFANCQLGGTDLAFPDVCKLPNLVPFPFPNVAAGATAVPNAWNILYMCTPAHNMATVTPITNGDNPGVATGLVSQTVMNRSRHLTGAFTILLKGTPATRVTSVTMQNSINSVGMRIAPSQCKILLLAP